MICDAKFGHYLSALIRKLSNRHRHLMNWNRIPNTIKLYWTSIDHWNVFHRAFLMSNVSPYKINWQFWYCASLLSIRILSIIRYLSAKDCRFAYKGGTFFFLNKFYITGIPRCSCDIFAGRWRWNCISCDGNTLHKSSGRMHARDNGTDTKTAHVPVSADNERKPNATRLHGKVSIYRWQYIGDVDLLKFFLFVIL